MEFRQLRYFIHIVEEGSFSAASRKCGIAQPSLSQQIRNLEDELGESLLRRGSRGVALTAAGEIVYRRAKDIVAGESSLLDAFRERGELRHGDVTFGVIPTMAPSLLPDVLSQFREQAPEVTVNVRESETDQLVRMVVDEEVEFAVVSDIDQATRNKWSLHVRTLFNEPLLLAVSSNDPLTRLEHAIDVADIKPNELLSLSGGH